MFLRHDFSDGSSSGFDPERTGGLTGNGRLLQGRERFNWTANYRTELIENIRQSFLLTELPQKLGRDFFQRDVSSLRLWTSSSESCTGPSIPGAM